ncbi:MAG TPA: hypothetical protein VGM88_29285 [Kofleriaceae bacterium]|jgi:hypothetical protein
MSQVTIRRIAVCLIGCAAIAGCAGASAEAPLTVPLGLTRDETIAALHAHQFCRQPNAGDGPETKSELFPRCDRPGTEYGDAWVSARFDGNTLIELKRWERFADDAKAIERWNQLVGDRSKGSPQSPEAVAALRDKGLLEPGTRSVAAFRPDAKTVVGIYLLTPTPPENAAVLESITVAK